MDNNLIKELQMNETDIEGAIMRFSGDFETYKKILSLFPQDTSMPLLEKSIETKNWDDAFTAVHALKGLAGNLGLTPLFHVLGELVIAIRSGKMDEISRIFNDVKICYNQIVKIIIELCETN